MTTQRRAKAGGEIGANGEFYEGGKFIATTEHQKLQPMKREISAEEQARRDAWKAEQAALTERISAWQTARRIALATFVDELTRNPGTETDAQWAMDVNLGHAGFLASLGRQLRDEHTISRRQAECAAKHFLGRCTRKNEAEFERIVNLLSERFQ